VLAETVVKTAIGRFFNIVPPHNVVSVTNRAIYKNMNALIETGEVLAKMGMGLLRFFGLTKGSNSAPNNSTLLQEQNRTLGLGDAEYRRQLFKD